MQIPTSRTGANSRLPPITNVTGRASTIVPSKSARSVAGAQRNMGVGSRPAMSDRTNNPAKDGSADQDKVVNCSYIRADSLTPPSHPWLVIVSTF